MPTRFDAVFSEALVRATLVQATRAFWRVKLMPPHEGAHFPPEAPCFVYGNHSHRYDPFFLNGYLPFGEATRGPMTLEQMRSGPVAYLMRSIGMVPTRKAVPEPGIVRKLLQMVRDGHRVTIYPEHGCRWAGRPQPWIEATAKLFHRAGVPVYPVLTHGSYVCWPRWATYPRPGKIEVEVLPPLHFDRKQPFDEVLAALKAAIDIDENVVPKRLRPKRAYRVADGVHKLLYRDPDTGEWDAIHTPDGTAVRSKTSAFGGAMQPDSRIRCARTGDLLLTGDLLDQVRAFPLEPDASGVICAHVAEVHEERDDLQWDALGYAHARLAEDHIDLRGDTAREVIPLDAVLYIGVERNDKLQLTLGGAFEGRTIQLTFGGVPGDSDAPPGSALGWSDTIQRLQRAARIVSTLPHAPTSAAP